MKVSGLMENSMETANTICLMVLAGSEFGMAGNGLNGSMKTQKKKLEQKLSILFMFQFFQLILIK
jgi:hypothetical protein